jgi:hypothetical protein
MRTMWPVLLGMAIAGCIVGGMLWLDLHMP